MMLVSSTDLLVLGIIAFLVFCAIIWFIQWRMTRRVTQQEECEKAQQFLKDKNNHRMFFSYLGQVLGLKEEESNKIADEIIDSETDIDDSSKEDHN